MKAIWKYQIPLKTSFEIQMPLNSDILHLQMQNDKPCLWVKVNPYEKETELHHFVFITTGLKEEEENLKNYLGTIMFSNLVYHLFEIKIDEQ